jgi:hypothetical protein
LPASPSHGKRVFLATLASTLTKPGLRCNDPRLHFGLGSFRTVDIEIYWPNGLHEGFRKVAANQLVTFREGAGVIPSKGWRTRTKRMTYGGTIAVAAKCPERTQIVR